MDSVLGSPKAAESNSGFQVWGVTTALGIAASYSILDYN